MPNDFCPILQDACVEARCKFWLIEEMANTQTGETKLVQECLIIHGYHLMRRGVAEQIRHIATTDKVASATERVTATLGGGLTLTLPHRAPHAIGMGNGGGA